MAAAYPLRTHSRGADAGQRDGQWRRRRGRACRSARTIEADRLYVFDRGYAKFALFNRIVKAKSSYVGRLRDNSAYEVLEDRPRSEADRAAGILSDPIVRFPNGKGEARLDHPIRVVCVKTSPHTSRGKAGGGSTGPDRRRGHAGTVRRRLHPAQNAVHHAAGAAASEQGSDPRPNGPADDPFPAGSVCWR